MIYQIALTKPARAFAALIVAIAAVSLVFQIMAEWQEKGDTASIRTVIWPIMRYFTHLTNAAVVIVLGVITWRGTWAGPGWIAALTVWTFALGVVYHLLLAATHNPIGLEVYSSIGEHTLVPIACLIFWISSAPKKGLTFQHTLIWTAWPLGYAIYAILRGQFEGKYPYFFLDPVKSGWPLVGGFTIGLGVFFVLCGVSLLAVSKLVQTRRPT